MTLFKIKSTLVIKKCTKNKTQFDITIASCTVEIFGVKIDLPSKQATKTKKKTLID